MGKQALFQEEIYKLNREIGRFSETSEDSWSIILSAFNSSNRAVNYFPVRKDKHNEEYNRWSFCKDEKKEIRTFLDIKRVEFSQFLDLNFDADIKTYRNEDDLHSYLIRLYNNFPVNPSLFLDGIISRFLPEFVKHGHLIRYAFVNLLHEEKVNLDYRYFPWVDIRFFYAFSPYDQPYELGAIVDQENDRGDKYGAWFDQKYHTAEEIIHKEKREINKCFLLEPFFFEYLQPLFMGYEKDGEIFRGDKFFSLQEQDLTRYRYLLIIPFYDAWIDEQPCGMLRGNILIPFKEDSKYTKRKEFIEKHIKRFSAWSHVLDQLLFESKSYNILRLPTEYGADYLKDFLSKIIYVQDWEKVSVLHRSKSGDDLRYCFRRTESNRKDNKGLWAYCQPGTLCDKCFSDGLSNIPKEFSAKGARSLDYTKNIICTFKLELKDILDSRVLPSLESHEMAFNSDYVLSFEFPKDSYVPAVRGIKKVGSLGDYYFKRIIPVFDNVLLKNRVMKHSTKSAVAAIISRNHSHHIGSHVTPRSDLLKIQERLRFLLNFNDPDKNYFSGGKGCERELAVLNMIRKRLDEYMQKKADFMAAIATEPLHTTITKGFFYQVILDFIRNSLLMDNLGANENVHYYKNGAKAAHNRIRIHCSFNKKDLTVSFNKCHCGRHSHLDYPYGGICLGSDEKVVTLDPIPVSGEDITIAWPGPLGEYALYCFLENMIRNAIKHNSEAAKCENRPLNIHVELNDYHPEYYGIQIWDDWSNPDKSVPTTDSPKGKTTKLLEYLAELLKKPIVNGKGQLRKEAWGLGEMIIMATLLSGSDEFTSMEESLKIVAEEKEGGKRLVYTFKLMKPKELAIISPLDLEVSKRSMFEKEGVWWFTSFDDFRRSREHGISAACFNITLIDPDLCKSSDFGHYSHLFPYRVLIDGEVNERETRGFPGAIPAGFSIADILSLSGSKIITKSWEAWIAGLKENAGYINPRIDLYLQQKDSESPTCEWLGVAKDWDGPFAFSVMTNKKPFFHPPAETGDLHFIYDRHFEGLSKLGTPHHGNLAFHEAFEKSSFDFISLFCAKPSKRIVYELAEAAFLKILVLDERIAEVVNKNILQDESESAKWAYGNRNRLTVATFSNLFIVTHVSTNGRDALAVHDNVRDILPRICVRCDTAHGKLAEFKTYCCKTAMCSNCPKDGEIKPHAVIIHLGSMEESGVLSAATQSMRCDENQSHMAAFLNELRRNNHFVIAESGRGIPPTISHVKLLPFSLLDDLLMKDRIAKLSLTKVVMSVIRKGV